MNQEEQILEHLQAGKPITQWEAIELWRCTRLGAYIHNLRRYGYDIKDEWQSNPKTKKHYKRYFISQPRDFLFGEFRGVAE